MNRTNHILLAATLLSACGGAPEDLCNAQALEANTLSGEWKVEASATGREVGFTYMFDHNLLKKITSDNSYTEVYDVASAGSTLYLTLQGNGEPNTYCVQWDGSALVLTQVLSEQVREEVEANGNGTYGHDIFTLKKVGM